MWERKSDPFTLLSNSRNTELKIIIFILTPLKRRYFWFAAHIPELYIADGNINLLYFVNKGFNGFRFQS